tara:strand:- start:315 stop:554 length:240 start_codon:yes stop_codon:yes gene_type:complete
MNREEYIDLFHRAQVNLVAFKQVNDCDEELRKMVEMAVEAEREACIVDIQMHIPRSGRHTPEYQMAMRMIERIRARGQA